MHILNEKLYGDFSKLPDSVRKMLTRGKVLSALAREGFEQDSRISSKTFSNDTEPAKAVRITAKELGIDEPKLVIFDWGDEAAGFLKGKGSDLTTKSGLTKSKVLAVSWNNELGISSKFVIERLTNKLAEVNEFTVYVVEHSENRINNQRKENKDFTDPYAPSGRRGRTNFMQDAGDPESKLRQDLRKAKSAKGQDVVIKLTDIKSFHELYKAIKSNTARSIQVDGMYVKPFRYGILNYADNSDFYTSSVFFKNLFDNGYETVGRVELTKNYVDATSDPEGRYGAESYNIIALMVNGDLRFQLRKA